MDPFVRGFKWFCYAMGIFVAVGLFFGIVGKFIPEQRVVYVEKPLPEVVEPEEDPDKWGDLTETPTLPAIAYMGDNEFQQHKAIFAEKIRDMSVGDLIKYVKMYDDITGAYILVAESHVARTQRLKGTPEYHAMHLEGRLKLKNAERHLEMFKVTIAEMQDRNLDAKDFGIRV